MARKRIANPTLFSKHFGVDKKALDAAGLIDPFIDVDTELFIDPVLLEKSSHPKISKDALADFRMHFNNFIRLLAISGREGDVAWKAAQKLLDLSEPPENGLGYGGSGTSGSSRPDSVRDAILRTSKEIVVLGAKDPEMVSLMGFFEEDVGPDTISDFTTRVIIKQLAEITQAFCAKYKVPVEDSHIVRGYKLPTMTDTSGRKASIVLVPQDIVRDLPVANDWSDIERAALQNAQIRATVNAFLGSIAKPTIADRKAALRRAALQSANSFTDFLAAVKDNVTHYDPNLDALGYYKLKSIFSDGFPGLVSQAPYQLDQGPTEVQRLVLDTINVFKHHVEKGNLWEELWINGKPKKERAAQLIYYAIADCYCRANNVDISPEANMGGGPVDFKFSKGYKARVLVEMKRSSGTVRHGYEKQLDFYKDASRTQYGILVVMDYGDLGDKLNQIRDIQSQRRNAGLPASEIVVIDATEKASASKRK